MARVIAAVSLCLVLWYAGTSADVQFFAPLVQPANLRLPAQPLIVAGPAPVVMATQATAAVQHAGGGISWQSGEEEPPRNAGTTSAAPILAFFASFTAVAYLASAGRSSSVKMSGAFANVESMVNTAPVAMISKTTCPFCKKAKAALETVGCTDFKVMEIDELPEAEMLEIQSTMADVLGSRTVPKVFFKGELLGGCDDTMAALSSGRLKELVDAVSK
jgi:glutaredoxin 3